MNDTQADYPDADTRSYAVGLSVSQAAEQLGLSVNAIRHKIRRGTLPAYKLNGEWRIRLVADSPDDMPHRPAASPRTGTVADRPEPTPPDRLADRLVVSAQQQVDVLRDSLVAPLVALTERQQTIISEQAEAIGRITSELDHARRQAEIAVLEREQIEAERDAVLAVQDALRSRLEGVMHFANFRCISLVAANRRTFAMFCVIRCQPWTVRRPFDAVVGASASAVIAYVRGCLRSQVHNTL